MTIQTLAPFLWATASTIVGGVILAVLFFLAREKVFPLPIVTGRWYVELSFRNSSYKPFQGIIVRYVAMLWREGNRVSGTAEKVYEHSYAGEHNYIGAKRTRSVIDGHIEKNVFSRDRVSLHIIEDGHTRESTHFHDLVVHRDGRLMGTFFSMAADSEGVVAWQRDLF